MINNILLLCKRSNIIMSHTAPRLSPLSSSLLLLSQQLSENNNNNNINNLNNNININNNIIPPSSSNELQQKIIKTNIIKPTRTAKELGEIIILNNINLINNNNNNNNNILNQDTSINRVQLAHKLCTEALDEITINSNNNNNPNLNNNNNNPNNNNLNSNLNNNLNNNNNNKLKLYTFGSTAVYGFHEIKSDVDFVALRNEDIQQGKAEDSSTQLAKGLQLELLNKLGKILKEKYINWKVDEVKRARVPVIKIKSKNIDFDITAFRRNGVRNSALLRKYYEQNEDLRWVGIIIKNWSKRTGMNGPLGYLTSYGFNIMVIYFLLKRNEINFINPDICCTSTIDVIPKNIPLTPPKDPTKIGELLFDFLYFYSYEFDINNDVITLSRENKTTKEQLNWTKAAEDVKLINSEKVCYRLCIEDPYEINLNVGRNITPFKLDMFRRTFEMGISTGFGLFN